MSQSEQPSPGTYRIAAVSALTGVTEATLRAWERRYGVPVPQRSDGGYRLYGVAELDQVREMRRLCEGGVAAAEAARVVLGRSPPKPIVALTAELDVYRSLIDSFLAAVDRFDDQTLDALTRRIMILGRPSTQLDCVIAPTLRIMGDRWHAGELSVAQEHLATQFLSRLLRDLLRLTAGTEAAACTVLGAFADDDHELGLLGTAIRCSDWGFRPILLGARTPPSAIRTAVEATGPAFVALSVTLAPNRARSRELVKEYADACKGVPWIVGGLGSESLRSLIEQCGGHVAEEATADLQAQVIEIVRYKVVRRVGGRKKEGSK